MARVFHWFGVFLLFAGAILLLITTISAPVIGDIAILKVMLTNQTDIRHSSVTFGTFGYCVLDVPPVQTDQDYCSPKMYGYKPAHIMANIDGTGFSEVAAGSADGLTYAMILHPIGCGIAFIAFLISLNAGFIGSLIASLVSFVAWVIALVAMAVDFAMWGIIKDHVNNDGSGSTAYYSTGMWTCLAAMIALFFGTIIVFFTCCGNRRDRKRGNVKTDTYNDGYGQNGITTTQTRKKRYGVF